MALIYFIDRILFHGSYQWFYYEFIYLNYIRLITKTNEKLL